jgi:hypothetical protein
VSDGTRGIIRGIADLHLPLHVGGDSGPGLMRLEAVYKGCFREQASLGHGSLEFVLISILLILNLELLGFTRKEHSPFNWVLVLCTKSP